MEIEYWQKNQILEKYLQLLRALYYCPSSIKPEKSMFEDVPQCQARLSQLIKGNRLKYELPVFIPTIPHPQNPETHNSTKCVNKIVVLLHNCVVYTSTKLSESKRVQNGNTGISPPQSMHHVASCCSLLWIILAEFMQIRLAPVAFGGEMKGRRLVLFRNQQGRLHGPKNDGRRQLVFARTQKKDDAS